MFTYKICYNFNGSLKFAKLTSAEIAAFVMSKEYDIESMADVIFETPELEFRHTFNHDGKFYIVSFSYDDVHKLNIWFRNSEQDADSETLAVRDLDYVVISCSDDNGNVIWTIDEEC